MHVLFFVYFLKEDTAKFSAQSVYCHRFGWDLCVQYMCTCRSLNAGHNFQCVCLILKCAVYVCSLFVHL